MVLTFHLKETKFILKKQRKTKIQKILREKIEEKIEKGSFNHDYDSMRVEL